MAALGDFQPPHPLPLLLRRDVYRRGHGHLRLPSHTRHAWLSPPGFRTHRALGVEENTYLHFHRFDVGLLLFFACEEGRAKGLSAELQEWLRGPTLRLGCLPWGQESSNPLVVPVSNLTAHHVPGTTLDPRTQGTAGAEQGLGQTTKAGRWLLAHGLSEAHRRGHLETPHSVPPSQQSSLREEAADRTASLGPGMEQLPLCAGPWAGGQWGTGPLEQDCGEATSFL